MAIIRNVKRDIREFSFLFLKGRGAKVEPEPETQHKSGEFSSFFNNSIGKYILMEGGRGSPKRRKQVVLF